MKEDELALPFEYVDLVDAYSESIYRFCRRLTYCREDADDLYQETFLKVFVQFDKISASDNPKGLLFSTALFIWKSWKRKYARRQRLAPMGPLDEYVSSDLDMEAHFLAQEENHRVRTVVEALPDKFRIPTLLYYTVEMSISEIASTLHLPEGTVKSRLFKARKLIEKGLAGNQHET